MINSAPIVPAWFTLPLGTIAMLILAAHLLAVYGSSMEPRRRRIRMATNLVMMLTVPILAYAASGVSPGNQRSFVLAWMLVAALLLIVLVLAMIDVINSIVLHRAEVRELRAQMRAMQVLAAQRRGQAPAESQ